MDVCSRILIMCNKVKLDKIKAMMIVAKAQKQSSTNFNRREIRVYFCKECNAYHTTSKKLKRKI